MTIGVKKNIHLGIRSEIEISKLFQVKTIIHEDM